MGVVSEVEKFEYTRETAGNRTPFIHESSL
jgi:hypothetical protein